jgi:biopolymer transport protein ExbD
MAEMNMPQAVAGNRGVQRMKKASVKVDLTPMVDLGFLLITFFIVTTAWSKPGALKINLPADKSTMIFGESAVLTLVPGIGNEIWYYEGDLGPTILNQRNGWVNYSSANGVGNLIRNKKSSLEKNSFYRKAGMELCVVIKPSPNTTLQQVVSLLDEMKIEHVKTYMLSDLEKEVADLIPHH